jgi:hypothetical protein
MLVGRADLAVGNARLMTGHLTLNQLAGPPVGAALFAAGAVWPFLSQAVLVGLAALLVSRLALPPHGRQLAPVESHLRADIVEGCRWVRQHAAVRTLTLTIFVFNITYGAAWSVLVLYAGEQLGLGAHRLRPHHDLPGRRWACSGTASYGWITRRVSLGDLMRIGLVVETLTHLGLALATSPAVAMPIFVVFGAHAFIWGPLPSRSASVPSRASCRAGWAASTDWASTAGWSPVASSAGCSPASGRAPHRSGSPSPGRGVPVRDLAAAAAHRARGRAGWAAGRADELGASRPVHAVDVVQRVVHRFSGVSSPVATRRRPARSRARHDARLAATTGMRMQPAPGGPPRSARRRGR